MYQRILLPTDGSARSREAIQAGVRFARDVGAQVFGFYVMPVPRRGYPDSLADDDPHYVARQRRQSDRLGDEYLAFIQAVARETGVHCTCRKLPGLAPHTLIIREAERLDCDLIYMASHGWKGEQSGLLGSATRKVVNASPVPVLVHRANVLICGQHGAAAE